MGMTYEEACDAGYDGPSPSEERQMRNRQRRNEGLDPRDPDYDERVNWGTCDICGVINESVRADTSGICTDCYEQNKDEEDE